MPAIAVVAAIGTVSAGAALGGVLGGIMIAGGVMSGVGAVTGNKTLMKVGALASLGAGIGSAMGLATASDGAWNSMVGAAADGSGSALGVTGNSFLSKGGSLSGIGDALGLNGGQTSIAGGAQAAPTQQAGGPLGQSQGPGIIRQNAVGTNELTSTIPDSTTSVLTNRPLGAASTGVTPDISMSRAITGQSGSLMTPVGSVANAGVPVNPDQSFIKSSLSFIKDNPEVVKAGSGLIGGAMTSYSKEREQAALLQAQADARARYNNSILGQRWLRG